MRSRPKKKVSKTRYRSVSRNHVQARAQTHVGLKRRVNEDKYFSDVNMGFFVVADGMGGHAGGDTASRMAVNILKEKVRKLHNGGGATNLRTMDDDAVLHYLDRSIKDASAAINQASKANPKLAGMGTTVTMMFVRGEHAYIAHVGDSRLYRLQDGVFKQITDDHSLVAEQIRAGFITKEEARESRFRNIITRSVGFESEVKVDSFRLTMVPRDWFLLCSDGLSGMVQDEVIYQIMVGHRFEQVASRLIECANRAGGEDNITVVVVHYDKTGISFSEKPMLKSKKRRRTHNMRKKKQKTSK